MSRPTFWKHGEALRRRFLSVRSLYARFIGVEGLSGFSTYKCPVAAVFCCPRARGKRAWETVTVESCQQAQPHHHVSKM